MDDQAARQNILDATDRLFYEHGIRAVGMDAIRDASGVSLRRLYRLFPAKEDLAEAVLRRRADAFHAALVAHTANVEPPRERILAIFDYLHAWFSEPDFRGCPFINAFGEAHGGSVTRAVSDQKHDFERLLDELVAAAGAPPETGRQLLILANGAMVTAAVLKDPDVALQAKAAAAALLADA
ncbi:MAG TPA: TetR/AcrR family transcriptional regulator [Solirubrobacter sp.]|nr:TetR/AcrR family transcriptional regulator [Solirubrobacter sp.]